MTWFPLETIVIGILLDSSKWADLLHPDLSSLTGAPSVDIYSAGGVTIPLKKRGLRFVTSMMDGGFVGWMGD